MCEFAKGTHFFGRALGLGRRTITAVNAGIENREHAVGGRRRGMFIAQRMIRI